MSTIPMHGKLLWKLMLKEQDSSTVCLDSSCCILLSPANGHNSGARAQFTCSTQNDL